jgi:hypothetical protein
MHVACGLIFLTGSYPLWQGWMATRRTSLFQALNWTLAAWIAWGGLFVVLAGPGPGAAFTARYVALCFTGCASVAVLGARKPGVGAWNFVLVGLLAVMLLPLVENLVAQGASVDPLRMIFLAGTVSVGVLNYLPTRLAPAALLLGTGCALPMLYLGEEMGRDDILAECSLALVPWVAWVCWRTRPVPSSEFDQIWLDFRDRFGFLWAQRMREQFNRSAANAGWSVILRWQGLRLVPGATLPPEAVQSVMVDTLRALFKRFGEADASP